MSSKSKKLQVNQAVKPRSKEEILADMNRQAEVKRKRVLAKNGLYPILLANTKSIDDAKIFCQALTIVIRQAETKLNKERTLDNLEIIKMIDPKSPDSARYKRVFELIKDEKVADAIALIDGMAQAIESFQREESTQRPLSTLQTDFLD